MPTARLLARGNEKNREARRVMTVCTGSAILASLNLLQSRQAPKGRRGGGADADVGGGGCGPVAPKSCGRLRKVTDPEVGFVLASLENHEAVAPKTGTFQHGLPDRVETWTDTILVCPSDRLIFSHTQIKTWVDEG